MYVVAKPFRTPLRRFLAGAEVSAADVDGSLSAADWVALGHLSVKGAPVAVAAPEPDETLSSGLESLSARKR